MSITEYPYDECIQAGLNSGAGIRVTLVCSSLRIFFLLVIFSFVGTSFSFATSYTVDLSGSGDFLQIQPAVDASTAGDTILVTPGEYVGEVKLSPDKGGINIIGTGGSATAIVVGDTIGIGVWGSTEPVLIENLEIREAGLFGGLRFQASRAIVRNCIIRDNTGPGNCNGVGGGAILVIGSDVAFENCLFENNTGWESPGGLLVWDSRADIIGCTFRENQACYGGGVEFYHCADSGYSAGFPPSLCEYNLFQGNSADDAGGAILSIDSSPIIRFNTLVENTSAAGNAMRLIQGQPIIENNVISGSGQPFSCAPFETIPAAEPVFGRNLVWDNDGAAVEICSSGGNMIEADPGYCDPEAGIFTVCVDSPCLEQENQLGAFGMGCLECLVSLVPTQMGDLKSMFR